MPTVIRILRTFGGVPVAAILALVFLTGCAAIVDTRRTDEAAQRSGSGQPWNTPASWEGPMVGVPY